MNSENARRIARSALSLYLLLGLFTAAPLLAQDPVEEIWPVSGGGTGNDFDTLRDSPGKRIAKAVSGNLYVAGHFRGSATFGGQTLVAEQGADVFVVRYDSLGAVDWAVRLGGPGDLFVHAVAIDSSEKVYLAGEFTGTIDLGGFQIAADGGLDAFVASFSPSGTRRWIKQVSSTLDEAALGIAVIPDDPLTYPADDTAIYVGGSCAGTLGYEGYATDADCGNNGWVARVEPGDGSAVWFEDASGQVSDLAADDVDRGVYALTNGSILRVQEATPHLLSLIDDYSALGGSPTVLDLAAMKSKVYVAGRNVSGAVVGKLKDPGTQTENEGTWQWASPQASGGTARAIDVVEKADGTIGVYVAGQFERTIGLPTVPDPTTFASLQAGVHLNGDDGDDPALQQFGQSVAVSGDTALVGSVDEWASVLRSDGSGWEYEARLGGCAPGPLPPVPCYGPQSSSGAVGEVALAGETAIVGFSGEARVFERDAGDSTWDWFTLDPGVPISTQFGHAVDVDGEYAVVSDFEQSGSEGAVYVFERDPDHDLIPDWSLVKTIDLGDEAAPGDQFGYSVALSGEHLIVGAIGRETAHIFSANRDPDTGGVLANGWGEEKTFEGVASVFGYAVEILSADVAVVSALENGDSGAVYVFDSAVDDPGTPEVDGWGLIRRLTGSDTAEGDRFGESLSLVSDRLVVGASRESEEGFHAGALYVFDRDLGGTDNWGELWKLVSTDPAIQDEFGSAVATDGTWLIAGSPLDDDRGYDSGSADLFLLQDWDHSELDTTQPLGVGDGFGWAVAVHGNTAVVGTVFDDDRGSNAGAAYVFERSGSGTWSEVQKLTSLDSDASDYFGESVAFDGTTIVVGVPDEQPCGAVYVFERVEGTWEQTARLTEGGSDCKTDHNYEWCNDWDLVVDFGQSVGVGNGVIVVGDPEYHKYDKYNYPICSSTHKAPRGRVWFYERSGDSWIRNYSHKGGDHGEEHGYSVSISGTTALVSSPKRSSKGRVYVYDRGSSSWSQTASFIPLDLGGSDNFGFSVALDGDVALIGNHLDDGPGTYYDHGSAYVFERVAGTWTETKKLTEPGGLSDAEKHFHRFGYSVALNQGLAVVGAYNSTETGNKSDSVHLFDQASDWSSIESFDTAAVSNDAFGFKVAAGARDVFVAAPLTDSSTGAVHTYSRSQQGDDLFVAALEGGNGIWQWATLGRGAGDDATESLTALGPVVHVAGAFQEDLTIGEDTLVSAGGKDLFVSQLLADTGDWFDFVRVAPGQRVEPPEDAYVTLGLNGFLSTPEVYVNGILDSGQFHHWHPPRTGDQGEPIEGELYFTRPAGVYEIYWRETDDPAKLCPEHCIPSQGTVQWPETSCPVSCVPGDPGCEACYQPHVAGAPVEAQPEHNFKYDTLLLPTGESSEADVDDASRVFTAPTSGWSVLRYLEGEPDDAGLSLLNTSVRFVVVRTLDPYDPADVAVLPWFSADSCTIGAPLSSSLHEEPARPGYVLFENAFYDAELYDRANRTGAIFPVNRFSEDRDADQDKRMTVAWYGDTAMGVYWPAQAVEYQSLWPDENADSGDDFEIVIAEGQGSGALPVNFLSPDIYDQPEVTLPGFNPNDEHAMRLDGSVFALRNDFGAAMTPEETEAPSDPYVLLKYLDGDDGQTPKMRVYKVLDTSVDFPDFRLSIEAGDEVEPPYPLGLLSGDCSAPTTIDGEISEEPQPPLPFYRDHRDGIWLRSAGDGVVRFYYSLHEDFFYEDSQSPDTSLLAGSCVPWLGRFASPTEPVPVATHYEVAWPVNPPLLRVGETLVEPEPGSELPDLTEKAATQIVFDELQHRTLHGLTVCSTDANIECSHRSQCPSDGTCIVDLGEAGYDPHRTLGMLIDPLAPRSVVLTSTAWLTAKLEWTSDQGQYVIAGAQDDDDDETKDRKTSPSVRKRLRYDPWAHACEGCASGALIFQGIAEPLLLNVMTERDREALKRLDDGSVTPEGSKDCEDGTCSWDEAVDALYRLTRNPHGLELYDPDEDGCTPSAGKITCTGELGWIDPPPLVGFGDESDGIPEPLTTLDTAGALSAGHAQGAGFLTVAFNDHTDVSELEPVELEVIRVDCDGDEPSVGQVRRIEPDDIFDEQVTLRHSGDFGGNPEDIAFEWYVHPDENGLEPAPPVMDASGQVTDAMKWSRVELPCETDPDCPNGMTCLDFACVPTVTCASSDDCSEGTICVVGECVASGVHEITVGGPDSPLIPADSLADNWVLVRYRGLPVCENDESWSDLADAEFSEGWVKRVVDRINPFDQQAKNFHDPNSQVSTIASMVSQLGERYDERIELTDYTDQEAGEIGLIQAYETVLRRAMDLSVNDDIDYAPANTALLYMATRLSDFHMLLGNEAYADAQDPSVGISTTDTTFGLGSLAPTTFCFQNQLASLLDEELVLLRGRDDSSGEVDESPQYNRLTWNFTSGLGEVAYQQSYGINEDRDGDGDLDEDDARIHFPQGHGDAWGHYSSALGYHYALLRDPYFTWVPRTEAVRVGDGTVPVDFQDERKFAKAAAARARAGAEIVDLTYRSEYVEDVEGQWQGYKDTQSERAWGLAGWSRRAGVGAYLDWVVGNAILPAKAGYCLAVPATPCAADSDCVSPDACELPPGIQRIDRKTVVELDEIITHYTEIQTQVDEADKGLNPLGLAKGVVPFDLNPSLVDQGKTHFEQVYDRAVAALGNAVSVWNHANALTRMLRFNQDTVADLADNVNEQQRDFLSRGIEIFGTPYEDDIGPGGLYPAEYNGFDWVHYDYIDLAELSGERLDEVDLCSYGVCVDEGNPVSPSQPCRNDSDCTGGATCTSELPDCEEGIASQIEFRSVVYDAEAANSVLCPVEGIDSFGDLFSPGDCGLDEFTEDIVVQHALWKAPGFGTTPIKPPSWMGQRQVTGEIQLARQRIFQAQLALKQAVKDYENLSEEVDSAIGTLEDYMNLAEDRLEVTNTELQTVVGLKAVAAVFNSVAAHATETIENVDGKEEIGKRDCALQTAGTSNDVGVGVRCGTALAFAGLKLSVGTGGTTSKILADLMVGLQDVVSMVSAINLQILDSEFEASSLAADIEALLRKEPGLRADMLQQAQVLQQAQERYRNAEAKGSRLLAEAEAFKNGAAADVQEHRYRDMAFRIFRNDALQKYRAAFDMAARYTYLAATAYDYDTNLMRSDSQAGMDFFTDVVRERSLGQILDGEPVPGSPGLADPLGRLEQNFFVLEGQMGFNNPQIEGNVFSLRREHFDIRSPDDDCAAACRDEQWRNTLRQHRVDDLWRVPGFRRYAQPFAPESQGAQPGLVIPFDTTVTFGLNYFGNELDAGDSAYDPSNFATRVRAVGTWFADYDQLPLSATPRVYLIPAGADVLRTPGDPEFGTRQWQVVDQLLPIPFPIGQVDLEDPAWVPVVDSLSDPFGQIRRFSSFRAYSLEDGGQPDANQFTNDSRLIGRSVWNTKWLLIIPGGTFLNDPHEGLTTFVNGVDDIKLYFQTYAYSGL